ncbi:MAG: zf-HC2 domain-containing protein [Candidatus Eisenbacteria bacterium]|nr:zf-HC2 domain-containing protein [Candidatus Eisenbacteria bacterium]
MRCEDFPLLSMAYLDGEMSPEDRLEFEKHLEECGVCRTELEKLRRVKEVTARMRLADLEERDWEAYWTGVYNRLERGAGWIFFSAGAIVVLAFAACSLLRDFFFSPEEPLLLRCGVGFLVLGLLILLVSVGRQRLHAWKRDPYRRVKT